MNGPLPRNVLHQYLRVKLCIKKLNSHSLTNLTHPSAVDLTIRRKPVRVQFLPIF
nr:MAG TPA: hypothetical protein [Caudoviricetes sp.]